MNIKFQISWWRQLTAENRHHFYLTPAQPLKKLPCLKDFLWMESRKTQALFRSFQRKEIGFMGDDIRSASNNIKIWHFFHVFTCFFKWQIVKHFPVNSSSDSVLALIENFTSLTSSPWKEHSPNYTAIKIKFFIAPSDTQHSRRSERSNDKVLMFFKLFDLQFNGSVEKWLCHKYFTI